MSSRSGSVLGSGSSARFRPQGDRRGLLEVASGADVDLAVIAGGRPRRPFLFDLREKLALERFGGLFMFGILNGKRAGFADQPTQVGGAPAISFSNSIIFLILFANFF